MQLTLPQSAQAIPLRMLETFTTVAAVERYVEDETLLYKYLERVFAFLIARNYFVRLRQLLDDKCPPLDGETLHAPNPLSEALLQLLLRPLAVARRLPVGEQSQLFCRNFISEILAMPHTEPLRYFVLPCLAESAEFPFALLLHSLHGMLEMTISDVSLPESIAAVDENKHNSLFYGIIQSSEVKQAKRQPREVFSSFLLNSLLILDRKQLGMWYQVNRCITSFNILSLTATLEQSNLLIVYVRVIAQMMPNILQLPKSTLRTQFPAPHRHTDSDDEDEETDESDAEEEQPSTHTLDYDMEQPCRTTRELSVKERNCLLESIAILNETQRVEIIVHQMEPHIEQTQLIYALCEICHNLMIYNKHAVYEYK